MMPCQLLLARGVLSTLFVLAYVNKDLKHAFWDGVPEGMMSALFKRSLQGSMVILISFSLTKYLSLVFLGLVHNTTPIVTAIMSCIWMGERLKVNDVMMMVVTFIGVTLITLGFNKELVSSEPPMLALFLALLVPFLTSYGNILMRSMKGLHENTVSVYMNPCLALIMLAYILLDGCTFEIYSQISWFDWFVLAVFSINTVLIQTFRYIAL